MNNICYNYSFHYLWKNKKTMALTVDSEIEFKTEFHRLIDEIQDMEYLKKIYECLVEQFHKSSEDFSDFTIDKLKQFDKSIFEVKQGHFIPMNRLKKKPNNGLRNSLDKCIPWKLQRYYWFIIRNLIIWDCRRIYQQNHWSIDIIRDESILRDISSRNNCKEKTTHPSLQLFVLYCCKSTSYTFKYCWFKTKNIIKRLQIQENEKTSTQQVEVFSF